MMGWSESHSVMSDSLQPHGICSPWNSPDQNTAVGTFSLFQGIFSTPGSNSGLPHCRQILYQLSHKGSPGILEWVAYPFSSGSSWPRSQTGVSCIADGFCTNWAITDCFWCSNIQNCLRILHSLPLPQGRRWHSSISDPRTGPFREVILWVTGCWPPRSQLQSMLCPYMVTLIWGRDPAASVWLQI